MPKRKDWLVESRDGGDLERAERSGVDRQELEVGVEIEIAFEGEDGGVVFDFRTEDARIVIFVTGEGVLDEGVDKIYLESRVSVRGRNL